MVDVELLYRLPPQATHSSGLVKIFKLQQKDQFMGGSHSTLDSVLTSYSANPSSILGFSVSKIFSWILDLATRFVGSTALRKVDRK